MVECDNICARCAAGEKGCKDCCSEPFMDGDNGFYLTFSDIIRISAHTGLAPEEFCAINHADSKTIELNPDDFCPELHHEGDWIGMKGDGRCIFLGENGCRIFGARPMMCKIHPFWFEIENGFVKSTLDRSPGPDRRLCIVSDHIGSDERIADMLSGSMAAVMEDIALFIREAKASKRFLPLIRSQSLSSIVRLAEQDPEGLHAKNPLAAKAVAEIPGSEIKGCKDNE